MTRQYEAIEHRFTPDELRELGAELGRANQQIYDLRTQKANVASSMASSIKDAEAHAAALTLKLNQRFETREVEVTPEYDSPEPGKKTLYRCDTGAELKVMAMTEEDRARAEAERQHALPFTDE